MSGAPVQTQVENARAHQLDPTLRVASSADYEAIAAVKRRNGLPMEPWAWLWRENPALAAFPADFPAGWVIEIEQRVVGYLGNVPLLYHLAGRKLLVAAAKGFAVDPAFRSHSMRLAAAFLSQKKAALLLNTSANVATSKIFELLRARRIPHPDMDKSLLWIICPRLFLASFFNKRGWSQYAVAATAALLAPLLAAEIWLRRRQPQPPRSGPEIRSLDPAALAGDYEDYWQRMLKARADCLLADRSARSIQWHFADPAASARQARMLGAWRDGKLTGHVMLTREDSPAIGLRRSRIVDLMAEGDDAETIAALLAGAYRQAQNDGSHVLEVVGFPARIRECCMNSRPLVRALPSWQFWYSATVPELAAELADGSRWYASNFDGDGSL